MARSSRRLRREDAGRVDQHELGVARRSRCRAPARAWSAPCGVTIETFAPTSALISVDLPALGAPISAMKPQRVCRSASAMAQPSRPSTPSRVEHRRGGGLLGGTLGAADPLGRLATGNSTATRNSGLWCGPGALHLAIGRRRQAASLRPFLQHGLRVAQRTRRRSIRSLPQPLDQRGRPPHSRRRGTPRRSAPRTRRRGSRCAAARPHSTPNRRAATPRRGRSRAPRRRRSRLRTRSASRRDSSPSSASGRRGTACRRPTSPSTWSPRNSSR